MLEITELERQKYDNLWKNDYRPSACAIPWAKYIKSQIKLTTESLLDIGCGDGTTIYYLMSLFGFNIKGLDISLEGLRRRLPGFVTELFTEATIWGMPFIDSQFDFTFSTDVLEHIPSHMVEPAIREIIRVTKNRTYHCIATFPHEIDGIALHLNVQPIDWWVEIFHRLNTKGIEIGLIDRKEFLALRWN